MNVFEEMETNDDAQRQRAALQVGVASQGDSPEKVALAQRYAKALGIPVETVLRNYGTVAARASTQDAAAALDGAPKTAWWLNDPDNAAVGHDQAAHLAGTEQAAKAAFAPTPYIAPEGWFERLLDRHFSDPLDGKGMWWSKDNPLTKFMDWMGGHKRGSYTRTQFSGEAQTLADVSRFLDVGWRHALAGNPELATALAQTGDVEAGNYTAPTGDLTKLGPSSDVHLQPGHLTRYLEGLTTRMQPEPGNRDAVGGLVGSVGSVAVTGPAAPFVMAAQGGGAADRRAGDEAGTLGGSNSILGNAALNYALGKLSFGKFIDPAVGQITNPFLRTTVGIGGHAAVGGATGLGLSVGSNLIDRATVDPRRNVWEGSGEGAMSMALLGGVFHVAGLHGEAAKTRERMASFDQLVGNLRDTPLSERAPERLGVFLSAIGEDHNVFVPAEKVRDYMQSQMSPAEQEAFAKATGLEEQLRSATPGADLVIPAGDYLSKIAPTAMHDAIAKHVRLEADGLSLDEASHIDDHVRDFADAHGELLEKIVNRQGSPAGRVEQHVFSQLREAGYTLDVARAYAKLAGSHYETRAARSPDRYQDAWQAYQQAGEGRGVDIRQEFPKEIADHLRYGRADTLIDAVRRGPDKAAKTGPSLLEFLSRKGGVNDQGGELSALDADQWHRGKRFRSKLVRPEGMSLADAAVAAEEAGYLGSKDSRQGVEGFQGATSAELLEAVRKELAGDRQLAGEADHKAADFKAGVDQLEEIMARLGLDPATQSNEEIKAALDAHLSQPGRAFEQAARGSISFSATGPAIIKLFRSRDLSTFLHEGAGHLWLEELRSDAAHPQASEQLRADMATVEKWMGIQPGGEITTEHHEQFARAAEAYFMEGKAPSEGLRAVFQRFSAWLTSIYKNLSSLNVRMSPEIRDVFARLSATDDEITLATRGQGFNPVFESAEAAGMTAHEFAAYTSALDQSNSKAREKLFSRLMDDVRRTRTKEWSANEATMREEIEPQINARPDVKAYEFLTRGKLPGVADDMQPGAHKLDRDAISAMFGDRSVLDRLPKGFQRVYAAEGGVHPDTMAEAMGFKSGEEMIQALISLEAGRKEMRAQGDRRGVREAMIDDAVKAEMLSRHGDMLHDGSIEAEAMDALHNDARMRLVSMEVRALGKKAGDGEAQWGKEMLEQWATGVMAELPVSKIRPDTYLRAERQAGNEAQRHLQDGQDVKALERKRQQLLNVHLYRASRDALNAVASAHYLFDRIVSAKEDTGARARDWDMVNAARAVLAAHGIGRARQDPMGYLEKVKAYDPDLYTDLAPAVERAMADGRPADKLRFDEFGALHDTVAQIWRMARQSKLVEIDGKRVALDVATTALGSRLDTLGIPKPKGITSAPTRGDEALRGLSGVRAAMRRVESWVSFIDGGGKGDFRTYIWNPVSEAADRYRADQTNYVRKFLGLVETQKDSLKKGKIAAPELGPEGYTFGYANSGVGKGELLHALLHTGNESNLRKLLLGRGWASETPDGRMDTTRWDGFINRMHDEGVITKADWDFVQGVWSLLEEMKPAAQAAHRSIYGRYFAEITARPFDTPFGRYEGGYVPAITHDFMVQDAALRAEQDAVQSSNDASMFPSPSRGFTKSRVENYTQPLTLDLGLLPQHIDKVLKFTHMAAPVRDVLRILKDKALSGKLAAFDPVAQTDMLLPWLNRSARQIVEMPSVGKAGKAADNFFRTLRVRTGANIMAANVSNALQQFTGLGPGAVKVKPRHLNDALWQYLRDPSGMAKAVTDASPFMATRTTGQVFEMRCRIDALLLDPTKYQQAQDFALRHAYLLQGATQNLVDLIVWKGAHEQALEAGHSDVEAVRSGDSAVRETQGSLAAQDVSRVETGSPLIRAFTQFYSYFNGQSNLLGTEFGIVARDMGWRHGAGRAFYLYAAGFAVPAVVSGLIAKTMAGDWWDDTEGALTKNLLDLFLGSQFRYGAGMVPIAGTAIVSAANRFNDKTYDDRLNASPAASAVEAAVGTPYDAYHLAMTGKGEKHLVRDGLTLVSLLTGIPTGFMAKPLGYLADIHEGKVQPTGPVDAARGLVTGSASPNSRVH
ncbi:MAG: hypothetical protein JWP35_4675 [Caulobacter sp.]|nr:hypothetical protein [Caulobacter sp.]